MLRSLTPVIVDDQVGAQLSVYETAENCDIVLIEGYDSGESALSNYFEPNQEPRSRSRYVHELDRVE